MLVVYIHTYRHSVHLRTNSDMHDATKHGLQCCGGPSFQMWSTGEGLLALSAVSGCPVSVAPASVLSPMNSLLCSTVHICHNHPSQIMHCQSFHARIEQQICASIWDHGLAATIRHHTHVQARGQRVNVWTVMHAPSVCAHCRCSYCQNCCWCCHVPYCIVH